MAVQQERTPAVAPDPTGRLLNTALGVWLFISAFLWPHTMAQRTNTWILGVLTVIFSLGATNFPQMRYLNTILAVWLFISAWALPNNNAGTVWNNVLVAIAIFVVSLVPSMATRAGGAMREHRASHA
jgi:hypothetical protein